MTLKGALCNFYSHLVVKFDFAFKIKIFEFMLFSASRFQTTASGISHDSRSYDNNMSSNTTSSSSFVSDDEVGYVISNKLKCSAGFQMCRVSD